MNEDTQLFVPTLNKQGYALPNLDPFSKKFTEYAKGQFLEIGAAFGYTTLKALENGSEVTANDLDERHLEYLKTQAAVLGYLKLKTIAAEFPIGLSFPTQSFRKILISRVLHFFAGEKIKQSLKQVYDWLEPNGELYVICETTYSTNWKTFIPEYQKRKEAGEVYPGEITNPTHWERSWSENLPSFVHWQDKESLTHLLKEAGFEVIEVDYINRSGQFPDELLLDGRESVGIIGRRPV